ncbi:TraB/GumN family protein [Shewanella schlegeliana]|uniref:TraB/GumN family protein n=1 Tax=Shewanella schlegeliana TaxID=190308 RepID=A0ABS1SWP6_9GAMM|nr:TraB/GumN family protein [Shewanella schlegeliana]MBL4912972.1 TraB/GumN family protein [Shewanella schlegeliana]MCL1108932.1 TraB/GumN family protein [Shewanella schlegeliana]GIU23641.1 protein GumN [Shewanella schlegeliana]
MIATSVVKRLFMTMGLAMLFVTLATRAAPSDKPPFYQISYQGQTGYLLGSIHVGEASFFPLAQQIEQAYELSAAVVVEADVRDADVPALLSKYGSKPLPMDADTELVINHYCQDRQSFCTAIEHYAPWLQSMQVSIGRYAALGYSGTYGIDAVLVSRAGAKPIYELESTEFQFELLSSFDAKTQWSMMREAIEAPDTDMLKLISAWRSGDEAELADLMEGEMLREGETEMVEKMLWGRNQTMAQGIVNLMASPETAQPLFIVVGAGHLVGQKSVQSYLQLLGVKTKNCWKLQCL